MHWLTPRAAGHQDVNSRLLEMTGAVLPLAFGAIYRGSDGVRSLLRSRAEELRDRLRSVEGRAEWIVSVERDHDVGGLSEALRDLDAASAAAPPGRAVLLGKRRHDALPDEPRRRDAAISVAGVDLIYLGRNVVLAAVETIESGAQGPGGRAPQRGPGGVASRPGAPPPAPRLS